MRQVGVSVALVALALGGLGPSVAQQIPPEEPRAGGVLISVDPKVAPAGDVALWLRTREGELKRVWEGKPYDVKLLRDGGVLLIERWPGRVVWLDRDKQVRFEKKGLTEPVDVELAKDGTIVVVLRTEGAVIGLDPGTGRETWRRTGFSSPFDVELTPTGGLIVADSGQDRLVELDAAGQVVRTIGGISFPNTVERLQDGGLLVTDWSGGNLWELDPQGKVLSKRHVGGTIYRAWRRIDGATVVATGDGTLTVFDAAGKVIATEKLPHGLVDVEPIDDI